MKTIEDLVRENPVFEDVDNDILELISGCGQNVAFEPGEFLFREGNSAERFFLLRGGTVALEIFVPGRGPMIFRTLQENEFAGTSWLIPPYRWKYDARATSRVHAITFDAQCMRDKSEADNRVGYALMKKFVPVLVDRLQTAQHQMLDVFSRHDEPVGQ